MIYAPVTSVVAAFLFFVSMLALGLLLLASRLFGVRATADQAL